MKWFLSAVGNSSGRLTINGTQYDIQKGALPLAVMDVLESGSFVMDADQGKLSDSTDSFLFLWTKIKAGTENFRLNAACTVMDVHENAGWQSGYGLTAAGWIPSEETKEGQYGYASAGRFRMMRHFAVDSGLRIMNTASAADHARIVDLSRNIVSDDLNSLITVGESMKILLEKTDSGLEASLEIAGRSISFMIPGVSVLNVDPDSSFAVGFTVSRGVCVSVDRFMFVKSPGVFSCTPADSVRWAVPDYPFDRDLLVPVPAAGYRRKIIVSPEGKPGNRGTASSPLDLETAVSGDIRSRFILVKDGDYTIRHPLVIGADKRVRLHAEHPGSVTIDASALTTTAPAMIIAGSHCIVSGLKIRRSPAVGIAVCGNHNRITRCETFEGKDTGILICAYPGASEDEWPAENRIEYCDSHDNCDNVCSNADGFGAKLKVGKGNVFYQCCAYHNIDDGFDLYNRNLYGSSAPVRLESCIAYNNGYVTDADRRKNIGGGYGFKMGGEGISVPHEAINCLAFGNDSFGFSCNSNPSMILRRCTAFDNGVPGKREGFQYIAGKQDTVPDLSGSIFPPDAVYINDHPAIVYRSSTQMEKLFPFLRTDLPDYRRMCQTVSLKKISRREDDTLDVHGMYQLKYRAVKAGFRGADFSHVRRDKQKLLFLIPNLKGGGAEKAAAALASHLAERFDVTMMTLSWGKSDEDYPVSDHVRIIYRNEWFHDRTPGNRFVRTGLRFKNILKRVLRGSALEKAKDTALDPQVKAVCRWKKESGITCSISFLNSSNYMNVISFGGEKSIISVRSYPEGPFAPSELRTEEGIRQMRVSCQGADRIVAVSKETADSLVRTFGADPAKVVTIYNACDVHQIVALGREMPDASYLSFIQGAEFVFANSARLTNKKGQWHIIRAMKEVVKQHPGVKLVILGRRGLPKEDTWDLVQDMIRQYGLEKNVYMPGFCTNPYQYLSRADAYVMASFNEGFPNALVEAMALSLPVISTDCSSGPREILAPATDRNKKTVCTDYAEYGILIPECSGKKDMNTPEDIGETAMVESMLRLIEDPELRQFYAAQSKKRAVQFSRRTILKQWIDVITD